MKNILVIAVSLIVSVFTAVCGETSTNLVTLASNMTVFVDSMPTAQSQIGISHISSYNYDEISQGVFSELRITNAISLDSASFLVTFDQGTNRGLLLPMLCHGAFNLIAELDTNAIAAPDVPYGWAWYSEEFYLNDDEVTIEQSPLSTNLFIVTVKPLAVQEFILPTNRVLGLVYMGEKVIMKQVMRRTGVAGVNSIINDGEYRPLTVSAALRLTGRKVIGQPSGQLVVNEFGETCLMIPWGYGLRTETDLSIPLADWEVFYPHLGLVPFDTFEEKRFFQGILK